MSIHYPNNLPFASILGDNIQSWLSKSQKRKRLSLAAEHDLKRRKLQWEEKSNCKPIAGNYIDLTNNKDNNYSTPPDYWLKDMSDRKSLNDNEWLTDAIINASQSLLKSQFKIGGLQDTNHGHTLTYGIVHQKFIQILNVRGNH